jgi:NDP-sugar pyrophosphorylase family protein
MKAIILAGGKGSRLAPYTTILPKPLMPLGDVPILDIVTRQLIYHGFRDITLAVGHLAELVMAYCGDGSRYNIKLSYSREETPLGTAGPIAMVPRLNETFLVMNGDILTTLNYSDMLRYHKEENYIATLATYKRTVKIDLGVIESDSSHMVTNYIEKPDFTYNVSMGIYIFEPTILKYIPKDEPLDLPILIMRILKKGEKVRCYNFSGKWLDIGRHDDYEQALRVFHEHRVDFMPEK